MKRGEIWWVDFDPAVGSEMRKTRPAIIVSNDMSNRYSRRVQVVPTSSNTARIFPVETLVTVEGVDSFVHDLLGVLSQRRQREKTSRDDTIQNVFTLKCSKGCLQLTLPPALG